jgi:site-specific recombinase XerD
MRFEKVTVYKPPGVKTYCFKIPTWAKPEKRHFNTHQSIKKDAEQVRDEFLAQRLSQVNDRTYEEAYLDKVIEKYLVSKGYLAKRSFTAYKATVLEFKDFVVSRLGKIPKIQEIDKPLCEAYLQGLLDRGLNPHTRNDRRNILTNFFIYAVDNDWLNKNPIHKIKKITEPASNHPDPLTPEEVKVLLDGLMKTKSYKKLKTKCLYEIMATVYYAGERISEVTHLFKTDIEFLQYRIHLHGKLIGKETYNTKTKKEWYPPIVPELEPILKAWMVKVKDNPSPLLFPNPDGGVIKYDTVYKNVREVMQKLGFPPDKSLKPCHRGRHTFTSVSRQKGVEEPLVQGALGHTTNVMTRHYTHLSPEHIRDKFSKLSYGQNKKGRVK